MEAVVQCLLRSKADTPPDDVRFWLGCGVVRRTGVANGLRLTQFSPFLVPSGIGRDGPSAPIHFMEGSMYHLRKFTTDLA